MNLVKYEATRQALIECATVDEVKTIKDRAQALANYARLSKDNELEKRSVEIRERARIRMGEITMALPKKPANQHTKPASPVIVGEAKTKTEALADAGISTQEASRAEKLAKKSKEAQEAHVAKAVESVEKRNNHETKAYVANNSGENEWYTPPVYVDAARTAMAAARLANLKLGDNQHTREGAQICAPTSQTDAAETMGVSRRAVQTATKVQATAAPTPTKRFSFARPHFAQLGILAHSFLLSSCALAICAGVISLRMMSLFFDAPLWPCAAARLYHA